MWVVMELFVKMVEYVRLEPMDISADVQLDLLDPNVSQENVYRRES